MTTSDGVCERHYVNLTNGLESLRDLVDADASWSFLRLQSTTIERQDWIKLFLADLSDDLLMHLALGWRCIVHDRGTNRPLSKTIYYALPLVKYVLDRRWHGIEPAEVWNRGRRGGRGNNVAAAYAKIYHDLFTHTQTDTGRVKRRVEYYRRYLVARPMGDGVDGGVQLVGACVSTSHDGDGAYYRKLTHDALVPDLAPMPAAT